MQAHFHSVVRNGRWCMTKCMQPVALISAIVCSTMFGISVVGQEKPGSKAELPRKAGGLPIARPLVPVLEPRPSAGAGDGAEWRGSRKGEEAEPIASFIDSLKGNDAAIEVVVGQGRLLTTRRPIAKEDGVALIAVGDPTILEFEVLPNPQMIRIMGRRAGVTDLTIVTSDKETFAFEVHVGYDLDLLQAQLRQLFPEASLKLAQIRDHLVVEGQARSATQVVAIESSIRAYLESVQGNAGASTAGAAGASPDAAPADVGAQGEEGAASNGQRGEAAMQGNVGSARQERGSGPWGSVSVPKARIINLVRVPGVQQVLLQVRVAELNRTAAREIGADWLIGTSNGGRVGTQIGGATVKAAGLLNPPTGAGGAGIGPGFLSSASSELGLSGSSTAFAIFPSADVAMILRALRKNNVLSILAEPNLVTMSGHQASFLAGGQFPVPVPQGAGGVTNNVTIQFKDFGVQLNFVPYILGDERIRLNVSPEVSAIDPSLGTTLVVGGDPVPGVSTRKLNTTVELRQGQTLALAGLMQVTMDASTSRIPGLGDLPYLGPFFSNTTQRRIEKELVILVSPYLVSPLNEDEVPCLPGTEVKDPTDVELYLLNRIEGRTGAEFRSTTAWDSPFRRRRLETQTMSGPIGFSP
ncbi:MAG: Type secretion system protein precursor [Planctomycetota bacterium]